jgi:hypothetical protein
MDSTFEKTKYVNGKELAAYSFGLFGVQMMSV